MPRGPYTHQMLPRQFLKPFIFQLTGEKNISQLQKGVSYWTELDFIFNDSLKKKNQSLLVLEQPFII